MEVGVFFGVENFVEDDSEATPEEPAGGDDHDSEEELLGQGEVLRFGQKWERGKHCRTEQQHRETIQDQP